tara:strand:+ start:35338 stop:35547 length:210 start_codon:yes stop_codon:yes gene_type:complete
LPDLRVHVYAQENTAMALQEHTPEEGHPLTTPSTTEPAKEGIDWNGPTGFWIALTALLATFIAVGIAFG